MLLECGVLRRYHLCGVAARGTVPRTGITASASPMRELVEYWLSLLIQAHPNLFKKAKEDVCSTCTLATHVED